MNGLQPLDDNEREELIAYLDGELDDRSARKVESKMNNPAVRAEADALKRTWELLDYLPKPEPSPNFTHRTVHSVTALKAKTSPFKSEKGWHSWTLGIGWAASVLLAGIIGFVASTLLIPREASDDDLARDLRIIENKKLYEEISDLEFLRKLDQPDLFGDDLDS